MLLFPTKTDMVNDNVWVYIYMYEQVATYERSVVKDRNKYQIWLLISAMKSLLCFQYWENSDQLRESFTWAPITMLSETGKHVITLCYGDCLWAIHLQVLSPYICLNFAVMWLRYICLENLRPDTNFEVCQCHKWYSFTSDDSSM